MGHEWESKAILNISLWSVIYILRQKLQLLPCIYNICADNYHYLQKCCCMVWVILREGLATLLRLPVSYVFMSSWHGIHALYLTTFQKPSFYSSPCITVKSYFHYRLISNRVVWGWYILEDGALPEGESIIDYVITKSPSKIHNRLLQTCLIQQKILLIKFHTSIPCNISL